MYLPVLLISRLGWPGFLAFALPNVIGCAGMGFVLHALAKRRGGTTPAVSQIMVAAHSRMMVVFSIITAAFQVFFAVWLVDELIPQMSLPWWASLAVGLVIYLLGLLFSFLTDRDWLALALVTYAFSIAALFAVGTDAFAHVPMRGWLPESHLWWLLPTLCFGFLFCPYLDLTFHRAAQAASHPRSAFGIFGLAFAIMLGLTVMLWFNPQVWYQRMIALLALGHIIAQLIFTTGAHLREVRLSDAFPGVRPRAIAMASPVIGIAGLALSRLFIDRVEAGEWAYLGFLACYGLLFPAYVIVTIATGRPLRSKQEWIAFLALVVICIPAMAAGFLFNLTPWLVGPVVFFMVWGHFRRVSARPA